LSAGGGSPGEPHPPIRNRIDMLATGIKSPLGIKVSGNDLAEIERVAGDVERLVKDVPGVTSALAERVTGGRYVDVRIDRTAAARFGLNVADVQSVVAAAIGGENVGETIEGRRRFPISVRYPRELRDSVEKLRRLPVVTGSGAQVPLGAVAAIAIADGPPMLRSENARLAGWVYVDIRGRDLASVVRDAQRAVAGGVKLRPASPCSGPASSSTSSGRRSGSRSSSRSPRRSSSCCSTSRSAASTSRR
jgi:Cu(I)/Ag(I) efflux system membrane protein CusA/SilA